MIYSKPISVTEINVAKQAGVPAVSSSLKIENTAAPAPQPETAITNDTVISEVVAVPPADNTLEQKEVDEVVQE